MINYIDHSVDDLLLSVSFNHVVIFEIYKDRIESFSYLLYTTNWKEIIKFHQSRTRNLLFAAIQVREVGHIYDHFLKRIKPVIQNWIDNGVSENNIVFITNYHTLLIQKQVQEYFNANIQMFLLRYFELDTVLKHRTNDSQDISTVFSYDKKYLALFGKPRKFMRSGAMIKMYNNGMLDDALISSLAKNSEIESTINLAKEYWPLEQLQHVLLTCSGNVDQITYDTNGDSETNYAGYPYSSRIYKNTFCSIIAETNDIKYENNNATEQFFITEKFARAVYNFHPFVVLSTPYFLKNIIKLGYQTFSDFISEDYDDILDPYKRLDTAINSAKSLANMNDHKILNVVKHNFNYINNVYSNEYKRLEMFLRQK